MKEDAAELVAVPPEIDPVHASMLKINPLTAWRLLHGYVDLARGDWLIQNAANSAAGRAVIQIAHELGFKTVNIVRRAELIDELRKRGVDVIPLQFDGPISTGGGFRSAHHPLLYGLAAAVIRHEGHAI